MADGHAMEGNDGVADGHVMEGNDEQLQLPEKKHMPQVDRWRTWLGLHGGRSCWGTMPYDLGAFFGTVTC